MWNDNTLQLLCGGQITLSKIDEIWTLAIPNQISTIPMHKPSLVRIYRKWKHVCVVGWHQNFMKFAQTRSPQCQSTHQVWVKFIDIYSSYHLDMKIGDVRREDNSVKNWWNVPICNLKLDFHNINAHIKFGENPLTITQIIIQKWKHKQRDNRQTDTWAFNIKL